MTEVKKSPAETAYDGIIPTGWLTCYGRSFSNIPYAQEMFEELEAIRRQSSDADVLEEMKDTKLGPHFEARHKLINKLIHQTGIKQIIEVAAGLSTRGLELGSDSSVTYVEVDLPAMVADKVKIIDSLITKGIVNRAPNLHVEGGNALEMSDLEKATHFFDPSKPILVVNEGLLRYLSFLEKEVYAKNVHSLLGQYGGVWITADISLPKVVYKENDVMTVRRQRLTEITGKDISNNLFKDENDAKRFFEGLGFDVESHSFLGVTDDLTSPQKLGYPSEYVAAINGSAVVFVMKPKGGA
jgi:O-methyltransferase involved in polyketide biosynthesis